MTKTKEEKILEHSETVLDDFTKLYDKEGIVVTEYQKLLKSYQRLNKQFNKTIHLSDAISKNIIEDNDSLSDNINYTVKLARKKIMHNVTEHRKTKEQLAKLSNNDQTQEIISLNEQLLSAYKKIEQLEKNLDELNKDNNIQSVYEKKPNIN